MSVTRRRFLSGSALSLAGLPLVDVVRPEDLFAAEQAARLAAPVFRHGVASGDPRADRVLLWTRVSGGTGEVPVRWTLAANAALHAGRGPRRDADRRGARLHRQGGRHGPRARHHLLLPLRGARRPLGRRPHAHAARRRRRTPAPGAGLVLELPARLLQRLRAHRRAHRRGRRAAPRRLHLRLPPGALLRSRPGRDRASIRPPRLSPSTTTVAATPCIAPIPTCRPCTGSIRSSASGTTTRSPTTPGRAAPRTTSRTKATTCCAVTPPTRPIWSGCPCVRRARHVSRSSIVRSPSAIWPIS